MQNKSPLKIIQILPILGILVIFCLQHYHAYQNLQSDDKLAKELIENLRTSMQADNTPSNIKAHILTVAQNASFQTRQAVSSLTLMTIFFQANILLMVYFVYSAQNSKTKQAKE